MARLSFRRPVAVLTAGLMAAGLAACSFSGGGGSGGSLSFEYSNVTTLDPQVVTWGEWLDSAALLEGLVILNAGGTNVEPGVAESWTTSPDGLTYTFKLRGAKWSDGKALTAKDFLFAYKRLLTPSSASAGVTQGANSYVPSIGIKGAKDFLEGKAKDWNAVGVKAPDDKTLQLTLENRNSDFLLGLTHPSMLPLPEHVLKAKPKDWEKPGNWVGNGPYVVKAWTVNSSMTLVPNKEYWDQDSIKLSQVNVKLTDDGTQAGVHYEGRQADIVSLLPPDSARFKKNPSLKSQLVTLKNAYTAYLAMLHSQHPAMEDVRVRQALSLAMGRADIVKACTDCRAAYSLVTDTLPGARQEAGVTEDIAQAKALLAAAGYPNGRGLPTVHIYVNNVANPVHEAIVDNWQRNLGIKAKVDVLEGGVYVEKRQALQPPDTIGFYEGSFGQFGTWRAYTATLWDPSFVNRFSIPNTKWQGYLNAQKGGGDTVAYAVANASPQARQFAALVDQATKTADTAAATKLYQQAAKARQDTYLILPVMYRDTTYAVRPGITGFHLRLGPLLPFNFKGLGAPKAATKQ